MPRSRLSEIRLPELELPEMSRDDIIRVVSDARRDVDLGRLDPRRLDLGEVEVPKIDLTRIDLSKVDLPKAMATAAQAVGLVRATRRSRLPFVVGGLAAVAIVGVALLSSPLVRPRLAAAARRARERFEARRGSTMHEGPVGIPIESKAYTTRPAAPGIESPSVADALDVTAVPEASEIATA